MARDVQLRVQELICPAFSVRIHTTMQAHPQLGGHIKYEGYCKAHPLSAESTIHLFQKRLPGRCHNRRWAVQHMHDPAKKHCPGFVVASWKVFIIKQRA